MHKMHLRCSSNLIVSFLSALLMLVANSTARLPATNIPFTNKEQALPPLHPPALLRKRREGALRRFHTLDGWKVSCITFNTFLPIEIAAIGLQQLYAALGVSAFTNQFTLTTQSNALVLSIGDFTLGFSSNENISWEFEHAFAARMWEAAGAGWTPEYRFDFEGPNGRRLVSR